MRNYIAELGQNMQFVAGAAHFFFAGYIMMMTDLLWPNNLLWAVLGITGLAAAKEWGFDARYEKNPPQTFMDNLEDFLGYAAGAWITYFIVR